MQLSILALNLVYAALGVALMYVSNRVIDRLKPEVDFPAELNRGYVVAIFIAPVWSAVEQIAPTVQRWRYPETLGYVRRIDSTYSKLSSFAIAP